MIKRRLFVMGLSLCLMAPMCNEPSSPGVVEKDDAADCTNACSNLEELGCQEGKPLEWVDECSTDKDCPDPTICIKNEGESIGNCGETCEMVCEAFVAQGVHQGLQCQAHITSCEQIESECR